MLDQTMQGGEAATNERCVQVLQAKKRLLDKLQADVAASEDPKLKRILAEDESVSKRREGCQQRVKLLRKAAEEVSAVAF